MYGMVNRALEELVHSRLDDEGWQRVCQRAGVDAAVFLSLTPYPDEWTYRLVGASAVEFGVPVETLLEDFGRWWIAFSMETSFGALLSVDGRTLRQQLESLDEMHARIAMSLPNLRPPSFRVRADQDGEILEYHSERTGLSPFVGGLVLGLADLCGERVRVEHVLRKGDGTDHDEFRITHL